MFSIDEGVFTYAERALINPPVLEYGNSPTLSRAGVLKLLAGAHDG